MKTSLHSLIPILPLFAITFDCWLSQFSAAASANSGTRHSSNSSCMRSPLYGLGAVPTENAASSIVACGFTAAEMCVTNSCIATRAERTTENTALLLLCAFASAGLCVPNRCLAMNYSDYQTSYHNIIHIHVLPNSTEPVPSWVINEGSLQRSQEHMNTRYPKNN
jgi:hypothetical protein